ncbi:GHKL domain-containing protein [Listeria rustica]|uniref:GHKL domain-containing protein n=1 Tax=Listeria rustica TaxID=2713503 RepID=A0A7W1YH79_9LIST|nr:GHKL domain-containing protein [Listeria rustica]MBA3927555.1 hypothetical protein [Listeria rustica]
MRLILALLITLYAIISCFVLSSFSMQAISIFLCLIALFFLVKIRFFTQYWALLGITLVGLIWIAIVGNPLAGWALVFLLLLASHYLNCAELKKQQLRNKNVHLENFVALLQAERHKNYTSHTLFQLTKNERPDVAAWLAMTEEQLHLENLDFQLDLQVPISDLPIEKDELIPFLSAILTNAKEAATQTGNGWITWRLQQQSGLFLLEVANATQMPSQATMDYLFTKSKPMSGLAFIQKQVANAYGTSDYRFEQGSFKLMLKLPAIKK